LATLVERYTNKRVSFNFHGITIHLDLSQGLFSSFDIDPGTQFLLKVVSQHVDVAEVSRIVDIGCGTGAIGVAVTLAAADCSCVFQDRDALALEFAKSNCCLNGIDGRARFAAGLGMHEIDEGNFDLILSNLPAKAGRPVLEQMIREAIARLARRGVGAVVVVSPLADEVGNMLLRCGAQVEQSEDRKGHRVYLFRRGSAEGGFGGGSASGGCIRSGTASGAMPVREAGAAPADTAGAGTAAGLQDYLKAYIRSRESFYHGGISYELDTAFNLPDFDILGRETLLAMDLMDKRIDESVIKTGDGRVLIWNPGQGHTAVYLVRRFDGISPERLVLGSRDALSLEITRRNMQRLRRGEGAVTNAVLCEGEPAVGIRAGSGAKPGPVILHVPSIEALTDGWKYPSKPGHPENCSSSMLQPRESLEEAGAALAILFMHPVPGTGWERETAKWLETAVAPGGIAVVSAGSTEIHRLLGVLHRMVLHDSRKRHGSRAVILKRRV
jgi:hypothetical protein